jgi:hypothetical protein
MNHSCDKCVEYTNQMLAQHARIVKLETAVRGFLRAQQAQRGQTLMGHLKARQEATMALKISVSFDEEG